MFLCGGEKINHFLLLFIFSVHKLCKVLLIMVPSESYFGISENEVVKEMVGRSVDNKYEGLFWNLK